MKTNVSFLVLWLGLTAMLALLPGCDVQGRIFRDGGEVEPPGEQFLLQSFQLSGTSLEPATVSVGEAPDEDGQSDLIWRTTFQLDDGSQANSLPLDDGEEQSHVLRVKAVREIDGQEIHKKVTISLSDS